MCHSSLHRLLPLVLACLLALCVASARADERFPFVIPGDDAAPGITDMSYLSPKPAGADGFVRIKDGHLATDAGWLRIWGFNTCFGASFPPHEDAEKVAAHLAKLGVNGIRMHHHDTSASPRGIWGPVVNGHRTLDPQQLDRQDYFLDQLNRHGIYVNLNLHVGRTFTTQEGFAGIADLPYSTRMSKYILYFEPKMRQLTKEFIREYLTHYNPYRKLKRCEDPGIAVIEITNENSFSKFGPAIAASLPEPYRGEFAGQWNQWLEQHYKSSEELKKTWGAKSEPLGAELASSADWKQNLGPWRLHQSAQDPVKPLFNQPGPQPAIPALKLDVSTKAQQIMNQELQFPGLTLEAGKTYTLDFYVKADAPRAMHADVSNAGPANWGSLGFQEILQLTPQWQQIHRVFRTSDKIPGKARICFKFGGSDVDIYLAGLSLRPGGDYIVLPAGQSLEAGNVDIPLSGWSEAAQSDVKQFMVDTEIGFIREITDFLKKDLGVRVPITASQITYHGADIVAQTCDYADIHAYWQHPRFPGRPWDPTNWTIANTPMEAVPDTDALLSRTPWRLLDRPFTISEWNIPDPNDYAASVVPFAAMVAALQDWDGVFFFEYQSGSGSWSPDKLQGYFSFNGQPAKLALFAACANLYRRGDLAPLQHVAAGTLNEMLPSTLALSYRIGIDPKAKEVSKVAVPEGKKLSSPDGNIVWDATDRERACVSINSPASRAVWGLIGGRSFDLGGAKFTVGPVDRNYAALVITSMDGKPLESAKRMLLLAVGSAQNQGMQWNEARTSVGNKWGAGPTQVNGIPAEVQLPVRVRHVYTLDGRGQRQAEVPIKAVGASTQFSIGPAQKTLWYEIEAD
jgi:hypothetical protein